MVQLYGGVSWSSTLLVSYGTLGCILLLKISPPQLLAANSPNAYESACENAYGCVCGYDDDYHGSYDYPWKSTKTRMTIHFHMNRNFPGGYPYDPLGYYGGLDDVPSCLHDVLDDVPWHWLKDP